MFDVTGKVALVTGGASGIGLCIVKLLLKSGVKAVAVADIYTLSEKDLLQEIEDTFGANRAIFIKTDISKKEEFENAFKTTIAMFQNIDILINNAGILNDAIWEKEISINVNGTINGCLLALENYMTKFKSGDEGVIVNIASLAALAESTQYPIYTATKYAILGLTRSWGSTMQYQHSHLRFMVLCPGATETPLVKDSPKKTLGPFYQKTQEEILENLKMQDPENVAKAVVEIIARGENGSIWVSIDNEQVFEVEMPDFRTLIKKRRNLI